MSRTSDEVLRDIREHPENHRHSFGALTACCFINGAIVLMLMDAHQRYAPVGSNGGVRCDSTDGPCACGAWH